MVYTYQCKKPFKHARNQLLTAITALMSTGRKVGLNTVQKKLQQIILENALTTLLESIGLLTRLQSCRAFMVDCSKSVFLVSFIAIHCTKVEERPTVPFTRNPQNYPKPIILPFLVFSIISS